MDLSRGYNVPPAIQARLNLLDWIAEHGGTAPRQIVALSPLFDGKEQDAALVVAGYLDALEGDGLIKLHKTLGWGGWACSVLPSGVDCIEQLQDRRHDVLRRRQAARDAFLRWLFACTLNGDDCPDLAGFSGSRYGTYYGQPFTDQDVQKGRRVAHGGGVPRRADVR